MNPGIYKKNPHVIYYAKTLHRLKAIIGNRR